jgi:hypothetical protein
MSPEVSMTTVLLILAVIALAVGLFLLWRRNRELVATYAPIIDMRTEVTRAREEAQRHRDRSTAEVAELRKQKETLSQEYTSARTLYDRLKAEVGLLEENLEDMSVGLYTPHYDYETSQAYKDALESIRAQQKQLVKDGQAALCAQTWNIQGDKKAGARMTKQYLKLILRAFNGECDAAMAKVTWNNVGKMEERLRKTYEVINELGAVMQMRITPDYLTLKLAELRLEYETAQKKREEQEEQRRIKEQIREEERALREAEKAQEDAAEEEARYQQALDQARSEMQRASGSALALLQQKMANLDAALHRAQEMKEKARCMAQLTRSGHVYVLSNIGSFGNDIFKIGMTRRLEPRDRIKELGDASVPFDFDVHALIYCDDAPKLEGAFHSRFRERSVNLVNARKEFFAVTIDEIQQVAIEQQCKVELTKLAEARDYRETLARRMASGSAPMADVEELEFPASV